MTIRHPSKKMSRADFQRFRELIYRECRIALKPTKKLLVINRLSKRLTALGMDSYRDYYEYVISPRGRREELPRMVDAITTNVTEFFRESRQFDFLRNHVWPDLLGLKSGRPTAPVRVWSSACSTGEEPYSLAISALEALSQMAGRPVWILASDVSDQALETAREGIYPNQKARKVPLALLRRYFLKGDGRVKVKPELHRLVEFRKINLNDPFHRRLNNFDIVFCRNVIIYFDRQTQKELMAKYYAVLRPGGYLFLGHSETLHGITAEFEFVRASIYRKPSTD